nr:MAG TPA: hypothetical protein [Bacteriophage sp.]
MSRFWVPPSYGSPTARCGIPGRLRRYMIPTRPCMKTNRKH